VSGRGVDVARDFGRAPGRAEHGVRARKVGQHQRHLPWSFRLGRSEFEVWGMGFGV